MGPLLCIIMYIGVLNHNYVYRSTESPTGVATICLASDIGLCSCCTHPSFKCGQRDPAICRPSVGGCIRKEINRREMGAAFRTPNMLRLWNNIRQSGLRDNGDDILTRGHHFMTILDRISPGKLFWQKRRNESEKDRWTQTII